ncbi:hypothetical protein A2U01_0014018, partial [Trifolium medium]|nr:hypothetical protein [Trifolium medium]
WEWGWMWRRLLFALEEDQLKELEELISSVCDDGLAGVFKLFWSCSTPSKFIVHGWRTLLDRVATKDALVARGDTSFVFCDAAIESCSHAFFSCPLLTVYGHQSIAGWVLTEGMPHQRRSTFCIIEGCLQAKHGKRFI